VAGLDDLSKFVKETVKTVDTIVDKAIDVVKETADKAASSIIPKDPSIQLSQVEEDDAGNHIVTLKVIFSGANLAVSLLSRLMISDSNAFDIIDILSKIIQIH
jgi:hypothetical protein